MNYAEEDAGPASPQLGPDPIGSKFVVLTSSEPAEPETPDELHTLAAAAIGGDRRALADLLQNLHPLVVRYCRSRLSSGHRSLASADDIAQEVCMAVITALPTYRFDGRPFLAFVYGIASHKVIDAHRLAGRTRSVAVAEVPESVADEPGPERLAVQSSVAHSMTTLLEALPPAQQEILRLRVAVGLSAEETAGALGMSAGAVRVAQHRALTKLRSLISGDPGLSDQLI